MDEMVLDAAKQGKGQKIIDNLDDPQFKGMEKWGVKGSVLEKGNLGVSEACEQLRRNGPRVDYAI